MENRNLLLNIDNQKSLTFNYRRININDYLEVSINKNINYNDILNNPTIIKNTNVTKTKDIFLSGDYNSIYNYIIQNPQLKNYRLIINKEFDLNSNIYELEYLDNFFKGINNIYIRGKYNIDCVTIKEYIKTIKAIDSIVAKINRYNLSPLEQILYVYDFVRQKEYREEKENEPPSLSRDISKVLFNDKIVCTGYSRLFNAILEKLNINSYSYIYKNINKKHKRHENNVVKIDDEKYNIHGLYYFDLTGDRNRGNEDYLNCYLFFAKTKENFDEYFRGSHKDNLLKGYKLYRLKLLKIIKHIPKKDIFFIVLN